MLLFYSKQHKYLQISANTLSFKINCKFNGYVHNQTLGAFIYNSYF